MANITDLLVRQDILQSAIRIAALKKFIAGECVEFSKGSMVAPKTAILLHINCCKGEISLRIQSDTGKEYWINHYNLVGKSRNGSFPLPTLVDCVNTP